jgi:phosphatidylserine/phosphatidylglycerophosphate/cardiolipin synthase-like enzyme
MVPLDRPLQDQHVWSSPASSSTRHHVVRDRSPTYVEGLGARAEPTTELFDRGNLTDTRLGASQHKDDPAQVARQDFDGLMTGEATVCADSLSSRRWAGSLRCLPDTVAAKAHRPMTEPSSAPD